MTFTSALAAPISRSTPEYRGVVTPTFEPAELDALAEGVRRLVPETFSELYGLLADGLNSFAYSMLQDAAAAEDAVQQAFLELVKAAPTIRGDGRAIRAWLFRSVRFRCLDEILVAEHRVEELEKLVAADAPSAVIADQVERATIEVDRLGSGHDLRPRLAGATAGLAGDLTGPGPGGGRGPSSTTTVVPTETTTVTTPLSDRPGPTTTTVGGPVPTAPPAGSTTTTTTTIVRPDAATFRVLGYVHAGPICPVARFPPDPDCADQPVAGAVLVITDEAGAEIGRVESNRSGRFQTRLPDGFYLLVPQPYDGLLGTAERQQFIVEGGPVELDVAYDTGIR